MTIVPQFTQDPVEPMVQIAWKHAPSDRNPDCETGIFLRSLVLPAFEKAETWRDLVAALDSIGFGLAIQKGRLTLTDCHSGEQICTGRYLGMPLKDLVKRFGKPVVKSLGEGNGDFIF